MADLATREVLKALVHAVLMDASVPAKATLLAKLQNLQTEAESNNWLGDTEWLQDLIDGP